VELENDGSNENDGSTEEDELAEGENDIST
jgi:hypothetical protein